jgi:hypothetical protein
MARAFFALAPRVAELTHFSPIRCIFQSSVVVTL